MKKVIILIFHFLFILFNQGFGQNPYYDALALKDLNPTLVNDTVIFHIGIHQQAAEILKKYTNKNTYGGIQAEYKSNPFINLPEVHALSTTSIKGLSNIINPMGGLNVTDIADGFAKFMVERAKEELSISFFKRFKEDLDTMAELRTLFPNTYLWLQSIDSEIYNFSVYLSTLREAFQKDLSMVIPNLKKTINLSKYNTFFRTHPKLKVILNEAILVAQDINDGKHPGDVIEHLSNESALADIDNNLLPTVQTLNIFLQSVRSKGNERYWISSDSLKLIISDDITFKIYLGLIYQKADTLKFDINGASKSFKTILEDLNRNYDSLKAKYKFYIKDLQYKSEQTEIYLKTIREKNRNLEARADYEDYSAFYSSTLDLLEHLSDFPGLERIVWTKEKEKYIFIARRAGDLYVDVNKKNYSSGTFNLFLIFEEIFMRERRVAIAQLDEEKKKPTRNAVEIARLDSLISSYPDLSYQNLKILKYATFAAQVAIAENSDQVEEAIEAIALPSGSSRIKRETLVNISLNAYLGVYGGHEEEKVSFKHGHTFNSYGIAAPIGVALSFGASKFMYIPTGKQGHFSHSLFISIIDIGAITAFRFSNDSTKTLSKIELKDIISPGIFYSLGIPKMPISINLGYQITPYLRSVSSSNNTFSPSYSRFSISFLVDIPLLNFYTKSK